MVEDSKIPQNTGFEYGINTDFPESSLKYGSIKMAMTIDTNNEIKEIRPDSVKNCRIKSSVLEPKVFLIPTSFALFNDWAVERFIKLTLASIIRNSPINKRI